jgi:sugar lactone lactonase YvrE
MGLPDLSSPDMGEALDAQPVDQRAPDAPAGDAQVLPAKIITLLAGYLHAPLFDPEGLAADSAGDLYASDATNDQVVELFAGANSWIPVAGTQGVQGTADGVGTAATFEAPSGLALDPTGAGTLYVLDSQANQVRKIDLGTGAVTTVAGTANVTGSADGTGPNASFNGPTALALDGAGDLFITDTGNDTIRELSLATGAVKTVAGTALVFGSIDATGAAARFYQPSGLVYDGAAGALYVSNTVASTIRKIDTTSWAVTTLAGMDFPGGCYGPGTVGALCNPTGLALLGGTLYVADTANDEIRAVDTTTGAVSTVVGTWHSGGTYDGTGTAAGLNNPQVLAVGGGTLYLAEPMAFEARLHLGQVRSITVPGYVVTTLGMTAPGAGSTDATGSAARFIQPQGVVYDGAGSLFVADTGNNCIRQVNVATGAVTTVAGTAGPVLTTTPMDGVGSAATFVEPTSIATDGAGTLYVADWLDGTVRQVVVATQTVTTLAGIADVRGQADGPLGTSTFYNLFALATDGAGHLYLSDDQELRELDLSTGVVSTVAGVSKQMGFADGPGATALFDNPQGLVVGPDGGVYVADAFNGAIRRFDPKTAMVTTVAGHGLACLGDADGIGTAACLERPWAVASDGAGHLVFTDGALVNGHFYPGGRVRQLDLTTLAVTSIAGSLPGAGTRTGPTPSTLDDVWGIAASPSTIFFTSRNALFTIH